MCLAAHPRLPPYRGARCPHHHPVKTRLLPRSPSPKRRSPPWRFTSPRPFTAGGEFVNEIGVIVVGVLIALSAEQIVEAAHWSHEVEAERQSLAEEAKDNLDSVARRQVQQPCVDRRLAAIRLVLERHAQNKPLGIIGSFATPTQASSSRGHLGDRALRPGLAAHVACGPHQVQRCLRGPSRYGRD